MVESIPPEAGDITTADLALAFAVLVGGLVVGYLTKRLLIRVARSTDVDDFVEGTTFERVADSFGTSTIGIVAATVEWFVYLSATLIALEILNFNVFDGSVVMRIINYVPNVVAAFFILAFGAILADKASVKTSERLEGVKVSDLGVLPSIVRYSIIFVAVLMALSQLGVPTTALHILLGAYLLAAIVAGTVALRVVLPSVVSGLYVLATQPYGVGDRIRIGEVEGVVQDVDILTTRVVDDDREYVVPNSKVFDEGVSKTV